MARCPHRFGLPEKKQECIKHECEFFTHLVGMNPQTGQPTDEWGCAIKWLPILLVENSNQQRGVSNSVDKVANQIVKTQGMFIGALPDEARNRLIASDVKLIDEKKP